MSHCFPTPSSDNDDELETKLAKVYSCIDLFQRILIDCSPSATNKLAKRRCIPEPDLKQALQDIRLSWFKCIFHLVEEPIDTIICDKISHYLIKALCDIREIHIVQDDHYRLVMNAAITPVIQCIMDEKEMCKAAWERQDLLKYFLTRLMSISVSNENHTSNSTVPHSSTCRASNSNSNSRGGNALCTCWCMPTATTPDQAASSSGSDGSRIDGCGSNGSTTLEGILILDILFEALEQHARCVLNVNLDIQKRIYNIMNITHLVDIVIHKFKEIKINYRKCDEGDSGLGQSRDDGKLLESVLRYEKKVSELFLLFDFNNSMAIFRQDLRNILMLMITVKHILKYNEQ